MRNPFRPEPSRRPDPAEQFARALESVDLSSFPDDVRRSVAVTRMLAPVDSPSESFRAELRATMLRAADAPPVEPGVEPNQGLPEDAPMTVGRGVVVEDNHLGRIRMADLEQIDPQRAQAVVDRLSHFASLRARR